jgi:hypothetical protein
LPVPEPLSSRLVWVGVPTGKVRRAYWPALLGRLMHRVNRQVGKSRRIAVGKAEYGRPGLLVGNRPDYSGECTV